MRDLKSARGCSKINGKSGPIERAVGHAPTGRYAAKDVSQLASEAWVTRMAAHLSTRDEIVICKANRRILGVGCGFCAPKTGIVNDLLEAPASSPCYVTIFAL